MTLEAVATLMYQDPAAPKPEGMDREFMLQLAQAFEAAGYDRVLVAQSSIWPDSMPMAMWVTSVTKTLAVMVAHRPGFIAPTMAARMFATLDRLSNGRAGIHVITGGNDKELESDGDFLTKEERYHRSREYVEILRAMWGATAPVSYDGAYYRFNDAAGQLKPGGSIPVYWAGASETAKRFAGQQADFYSTHLLSLAETGALAAEVSGYAADAGRSIRFQGSARVILGDTEEQAWANAKRVAERLAEEREARLSAMPSKKGSLAADRIAQAAEVEMIDERLWTGTHKASGGGISPAFVGTPEQVAEAQLKYYDLGFRSFFLRGFDPPFEDIKRIGEQLIPLLKAGAAKRDAEGA